MDLKVTGLARDIKNTAGKYPTGCKAEWYLIAKMVIEKWNDTTEPNHWCNLGEQLQALQLAKGTERSLQQAIRKAK